MSLRETGQILSLPLPRWCAVPIPVRWASIPSGFGGNFLQHTRKPWHQRRHTPGLITQVQTPTRRSLPL